MLLIHICDVLLLNEVIPHYGFFGIHTFPLKCCVFVIHLFGGVPQTQLNPNVIFHAKFKELTMTCELVIWDFIGHVLIHYFLGCIFNGKSIAPSHWAMCLIEKATKHSCLINLAWFESL